MLSPLFPLFCNARIRFQLLSLCLMLVIDRKIKQGVATAISADHSTSLLSQVSPCWDCDIGMEFHNTGVVIWNPSPKNPFLKLDNC